MIASLTTKNPIVGTRLTPAIIRDINAAIRRNQPIAGRGVTITRTIGGTIINAIAVPSRGVAVVGESIDKGCFAVRGKEIVNCFIWVGAQLKTLPPITITKDFYGKYLCVDVRSASSVSSISYALYSSLDNLNAASATQDVSVVPIYKFEEPEEGTETGTEEEEDIRLPVVEIDFRNIPRSDTWAVVA